MAKVKPVNEKDWARTQHFYFGGDSNLPIPDGLKGAELGEEVVVVVRGKVRHASFTESIDSGDSASLEVVASEITVSGTKPKPATLKDAMGADEKRRRL